MDLSILSKQIFEKANISTTVLLCIIGFFSLSHCLLLVCTLLLIKLISNQGSVPWNDTVSCPGDLSMIQLFTTEKAITGQTAPFKGA